MSRSSIIRKKALEFVKKREWDKALKEFLRLSEIEEHNPNVFNELGDLHLKVGQKSEAFLSFHSAIDAYSRVGLYNNAVAVCKKIIRLNQNDHAVYGKLAKLRNQQGFQREAASYAITYLNKLVQDSTIEPESLRDQVMEMAMEMPSMVEVLDCVADYLMKWEFQTEAGQVLEKLESAYSHKGLVTEAEATREKMLAMGHEPPASAGGATGESEGEAEAQYDPHNVDIGSSPSLPDASTPRSEPRLRSESRLRSEPSAVHEYGSVALDHEVDRSVTSTEPAPADHGNGVPESAPAPKEYQIDPSSVQPRLVSKEVDEIIDPPRYADPVADESFPMQEIDELLNGPAIDVPASRQPRQTELLDDDDAVRGGATVGSRDIVGQFSGEVTADVDNDDFRSHYDLGMAYLEMDLVTEAIREFQLASNSRTYQVRSLEMIGLCFLKKNQPRLAIRQLERGLALVREGEREALGLQYNLGLAHEMNGDPESAKSFFEDVYVVDVAFRDVSEKVKSYS